MKIKDKLEEFKYKIHSTFKSLLLFIAGVIAGAMICTCTSCTSRDTHITVENNSAGTTATFTVSNPDQIFFDINSIKDNE